MTDKKNRKNKYRPPVVALLGHVDHGKTTILDSIRQSSVQEKEVGGITQSISCWTIEADKKEITFIDTPGHEAFNLMRVRGGEVADIVVLVVAADDGVQPQTKESIEIIKQTDTPCIVAIKKIDIQGVDIDKVKRELATEELLVEGMGGDIPVVELSGETGEGIDDLLELINLVVEMHDIKTVESKEGTVGTAFVLESFKDKSRGNVSTVVITAGQFERGNSLAYLDEFGELVVENIKGLLDEDGKGRKIVDQGYGAKIIGLSNILELGQVVYNLEDKKAANIEMFEVEEKEAKSEETAEEDVDTDDLLAAVLSEEAEEEEGLKKLKVVLKAESKGTLQAVEKSLEDVNEEEFLIEVVRSGVGNIHVNDVEYAKNLGAIVIGFGVEKDRVAEEYAGTNKILVRVYDLIYDLIDELEDAAIAMQEPEEVEEVTGEAEVRQIFELSDGTRVVGVRISDGEIRHGLQCRIMHKGNEVGRGKINSMQCGKEKVTSTTKGNECGLIIDYKDEIEEGDTLVCYRIVKK